MGKTILVHCIICDLCRTQDQSVRSTSHAPQTRICKQPLPSSIYSTDAITRFIKLLMHYYTQTNSANAL